MQTTLPICPSVCFMYIYISFLCSYAPTIQRMVEKAYSVTPVCLSLSVRVQMVLAICI